MAFRHIGAAMGLAVMLAVSVPASAVVKTARYSGTITSGTDVTGEFVAAGGDLAGYAFTAAITIDTALGIRTTSDTSDRLIGGTGAGASSPLTNAVLIINGRTYSFARSPIALAVAIVNAQEVVHNSARMARIDGLRIFESILFQTPQSIPPWRLDQNVAPMSFENGAGRFAINVTDSESLEVVRRVTGEFGPNMIYSVTGVPEPESWPLMVGGFGLVGGMVRRRRLTNITPWPSRHSHAASAL